MEGTLKLKVNREKSRTISVFTIRNFKYLGFCFGKNGKGIYATSRDLPVFTLKTVSL